MWYDAELTTLAFCWRIERRDGVTLAFTSHDRDLWIGGLRHRAAPGMVPSAIATTDGLDVGTLDIGGALTSDAIRADELAAGRWDGARLRLTAVDWSAPEDAPVLLARGELGDIEIRDGGFGAELRGLVALLERPVVEATSPECRAMLGDRRCRVDLAPRTRVLRVASVVDAVTLDLDAPEPVADAYGYGVLRWMTGPNVGIDSAVAGSSGTRIWLRDPPPFPAEPGVRVQIVEGCDRSFATCRDRFDNALNFRGEPHLPGADLLTRYPGA